jgi:hypothetical protein
MAAEAENEFETGPEEAEKPDVNQLLLEETERTLQEKRAQVMAMASPDNLDQPADPADTEKFFDLRDEVKVFEAKRQQLTEREDRAA